MSTTKRAMCVLAVLAIFAAVNAQAGTINWSFYTATGSGDVSWVATPAGSTHVIAVNVGNTGLADSTYGVPAGESWAWKGVNSASGGVYRYSDASNSVSMNVSAGGGPHNGFYSGGDSLLTNAVYADWGKAASVNLENMLVIGREYNVQMVIADTRAISAGQTVDFGDGSGKHQYAYTNGQYLVAKATFVADSTSISFTPVNYSGTTNVGAQINGVLVSTAVPEPSTLAILAGGLIGLIAYAWRKRK